MSLYCFSHSLFTKCLLVTYIFVLPILSNIIITLTNFLIDVVEDLSYRKTSHCFCWACFSTLPQAQLFHLWDHLQSSFPSGFPTIISMLITPNHSSNHTSHSCHTHTWIFVSYSYVKWLEVWLKSICLYLIYVHNHILRICPTTDFSTFLQDLK